MVNLPRDKVPIEVKWVFKTKLKPDGSVAKYKARLVAKGFMQRKGIDFSEVFALVARLETIRMIVALASWKNWSLRQLDVKSAFLNGMLDEEVFITQPLGFVSKGNEHKVLRLRKALYGLRQAPRAWNKRIDNFLHRVGFLKCTTEYGVYVKSLNVTETMLIYLYVDDLLVTGSSSTCIDQLKEDLKREFEMTDLGALSYFLGLEFAYDRRGIIMHQRKYILEVLKKFNMMDCNPAATPAELSLKLIQDETEVLVDETLYRQMIGSLRYICHSRPEITYSVGIVSRFLSNPKQSHLVAAKRILRYLKATLGYGLIFLHQSKEGDHLQLLAYSDSDWSGDATDRKTTSG